MTILWRSSAVVHTTIGLSILHSCMYMYHWRKCSKCGWNIWRKQSFFMKYMCIFLLVQSINNQNVECIATQTPTVKLYKGKKQVTVCEVSKSVHFKIYAAGTWLNSSFIVAWPRVSGCVRGARPSSTSLSSMAKYNTCLNQESNPQGYKPLVFALLCANYHFLAHVLQNHICKGCDHTFAHTWSIGC